MQSPRRSLLKRQKDWVEKKRSTSPQYQQPSLNKPFYYPSQQPSSMTAALQTVHSWLNKTQESYGGSSFATNPKLTNREMLNSSPHATRTSTLSMSRKASPPSHLQV